MNPKTVQIGKQQSIFCIFEAGLPTMARVKIHSARPVTFPDFEAFCFYVHKYFNTEDNRWAVTEGYSGMTVCTYERSRKQAVEAALSRLQNAGPEKFRRLIQDAYKKYGYIYDHRLIEVDANYSEVDVDNISNLAPQKIRELMSRPYT